MLLFKCNKPGCGCWFNLREKTLLNGLSPDIPKVHVCPNCENSTVFRIPPHQMQHCFLSEIYTKILDNKEFEISVIPDKAVISVDFKI